MNLDFMKNKFMVITALVILLLGSYYSLSLLGLTGASQVITVSDTGFTPANITVKKNTRVIFKNIGSKPHWPASDFHPTHGIYPQFDPTKEILPGNEWTFRFEKTGKWKLHDHLFPELKGVITVVE